MRIIFFVILVDLIGFGIMIPLLPNFAVKLSGSPELATTAVALYAIGIMFGTPILGRISDYYGRRPVLLISMIGAVGGYLILAVAETLIVIAFARLFSGLMAGNIAAAQAYVTDITNEENRAKGMGMIGAAFGLGFIVGPFLGTMLAGDDFSSASLTNAALTSAVLSTIAFFVILLKLPESHSEENRATLRAETRVGQIAAIKKVSARPVIMMMLLTILTYNVAAGMSETILPIWAEAVGIAKGPPDLRAMLIAAGLTLAIVQGGLIGPLSKKFGEKALVVAGFVIYATGMIAMAQAGSMSSEWGAVAALSWLSGGAGLIIPSMQSLISKRAGETERGIVMGVYGSFGMAGRIIGAVTTGVVFANIHINAPYYGGAALVTILLILAFILGKKINQKPHIA